MLLLQNPIQESEMEKAYQICTRCVMDTTDTNITFDDNGICNHCRDYETRIQPGLYTGDERQRIFNKIVTAIKKAGQNKDYDCVLGVSGGVDSTYVAYIVKQAGLRPLAVHLDNGWDSELAVYNIERTLKKLDIDLLTHVIDWDEFRDIQLAYLKASVIDIEAITDHAILATVYNTAVNNGIKYILIGSNMATESISLDSWTHPKNDLTNLKAIHRLFGKVKLETFPTMSLYRQAYYTFVKSIRSVPILDYIPYVKEEAIEVLRQELNWKDYGFKHGESIFTRFYQGYILPTKFNVDKRRAHLSNLIHSGQLTREKALAELQNGPYSEENLREDKEYCIKKLGLTEEEFEAIMKLPIKSHLDYKSDNSLRKPLMGIYRMIGGLRY